MELVGAHFPAWLRTAGIPREALVATRARYRSWLLVATEWALILVWATFVGRAYLDFNPSVWPSGGDFALHAYHYFFWSHLKECGLCALWNGDVNGGNPALADQYGGVLHPAIVLPALFLPPINAVKVSIILSLAMGGWAQWWIGRVLGLGAVARLWGAALGVVGGHLTGRMEWGQNIMILTVAAACMTVAPALDLGLTGRPRAAVWLAITLALVAVTGHGYMQLAVAVCLLPALLLLVIGGRAWTGRRLRALLLAGGLAVLLGGFYLLPMLHFWPNFGKSVSPDFLGPQPMEYIPLNLVIHDRGFFSQEAQVLGKRTAIESYYNYVGWLPVLFAVAGLAFVPRRVWRVFVFFVVGMALVFFWSSAAPLRVLREIAPTLATMRQPPLIAFFATPFVIGLAQWGVDALMKANWPSIAFSLSGGTGALDISTSAIMPVLLVWSVGTAYAANQPSLRVESIPSSYDTLASVVPPSPTEWVRPTGGDLHWLMVLPNHGLKTLISRGDRQWGWIGREDPPAYYAMDTNPPTAPAVSIVNRVDQVLVTTDSANPYAYVEVEGEKVPCQAMARGGNIQIDCNADASGVLTVHENMYNGWGATRDGNGASLQGNRWLMVDAPAGAHHYEFRYRPWDAFLGLGITLLGLTAAVLIWVRHPAREAIAYNP